MASVNLAVLVITCLTALAILVYICVKNKEVNIGGIVDHAAQEAAFNSTVFIIHDKSSNTVCNRLITVRPFDWMIWACRGDLYILNPEGGIQCSAGHTPAVKVYADQFVETCLTLSYDTIISSYSKNNGAKIKHVPYEIEGSTFTILTALNILAKDWITFDTATQSTIGKLRDIIPTTEEHGRVKRSVYTQTGRTLTPQQVVRYVGPRVKNYLTSAELENVFKHLARHESKYDKLLAQDHYRPRIIEWEPNYTRLTTPLPQ